MQKFSRLNVLGTRVLNALLFLAVVVLTLTGTITLADAAAIDGDHFQDASGGNTTVTNQVVRKGWGFMPGNGKFAIEDIPIDYGLDFDELPFLVVKFANSKQVADGDPTDLADCSITRNVIATGVNQTTSGFKPILRTPTGLGFPSATNYCYTWIAIGRHDASYDGENDPVFGSWDKSAGISITESQITDLDHFSTADETDPVFKAWDKSAGISITESQISDLSHTTDADITAMGYIKSYTESDPKVGSLSANSIPKWKGSTLIDSISLFESLSGNVGIGTINPTELLHVQGDAYISGDLTVDGALNGMIDAALLEGYSASELVESAASGYLPSGRDIPVLTIEVDGVQLSDTYTLDGKTFNISIEVIEYLDGTVLRKRPGEGFYGDIKLSHVINAGSTSEFASWYSDIKAGISSDKDVSMMLYDSVNLIFLNAWPSAVQQLSIGSNQILETITLTSDQIDLDYYGTLNLDTSWYSNIQSVGPVYSIDIEPMDSETDVIEYQEGGDYITRKRPGHFRTGYLNLLGISPEDIFNKVWSEHKNIIETGGIGVNKKNIEVGPVVGGSIWNYYDCWPSEFQGLSYGKATNRFYDVIIFESLKYSCDDVIQL